MLDVTVMTSFSKNTIGEQFIRVECHGAEQQHQGFEGNWKAAVTVTVFSKPENVSEGDHLDIVDDCRDAMMEPDLATSLNALSLTDFSVLGVLYGPIRQTVVNGYWASSIDLSLICTGAKTE
jgi:hypothetical protein